MSELSNEDKNLIESEEEILRGILASIREQREALERKFISESTRSRELTSALVAFRRDEDKQLIASDEAVSHALKEKFERDIKVLTKLLDKPYFARVVLSERDEKGTSKPVEYRIGALSNSDCRIIDWRKAPISKLYFEYKEGEEYAEEIQGRERRGTVSLRLQLEISKGILRKVSSKRGVFEKHGSEWRKVSAERRGSDARGMLPDILSLITAEQFRAITEDANSAVLVQGVAGSGKTTVALYRLSWLLHEGNASLKPDLTPIIVHGAVLRNYIQQSLPLMNLEEVPVFTYGEWSERCLKHLFPLSENGELPRADTVPPARIRRVKSSYGMLRALEAIAINASEAPTEELLKVLGDPRAILESDTSKLLDEPLIREAFLRTKANFESGVCDPEDEPLLIRILEKQGALEPFQHLILDEVQDFSLPHLASLVGAVKETKDLTLVGDVAQKTSEGFPGWEKLRSIWNFSEEDSRYFSLEVSHRSTLPIMRLADYVQERDLIKEGRPGRVPIWFHCKRERDGIDNVIKWLTKATELYPSAITAVLCRDIREARLALSYLQPTFGFMARLGDESFFTFEEGIVVTSIASVKGLEFCNALLWNPSRKTYDDSGEDGELNRNLLYIGITRAEENLCIVTWQRPAAFLPPISSKIVRGVDLTKEEDEGVEAESR